MKRLMIAVASVVCFLGLSSTMAADKKDKKEPIVLKSKAQLTDFADNTVNYKEKLITMELEYNARKPLRDGIRPGGPIMRYPFYSVGGNFDIQIDVSLNFDSAEYKKAEDLPNANSGDRLLVTFFCDNGSLKDRNRAIKIVRPK
ncbi:MAG: hypothetical protein WCL32_20930 [Planctomycetota bacterium]